MDNKKGKCSVCKFFERYYTMGDKRFNKTNFGWCCKKQSVINTNNTCDKFVYKPRMKVVTKGTRRYLAEILVQLFALRCIVQEQQDDTDKN